LRQVACWKKATLFWPKRLLKRRNYFMLTKTLAEKVRLLLLPKLTWRKDKPILETYGNQPRIKPKPRNKANQNQREPKHQQKNLEADFSDSAKPTWT
jgi:hypothetical protein